jgi:hypothetical protein
MASVLMVISAPKEGTILLQTRIVSQQAMGNNQCGKCLPAAKSPQKTESAPWTPGGVIIRFKIC